LARLLRRADASATIPTSRGVVLIGMRNKLIHSYFGVDPA
jgi:uncharacterized protein with HEPN domain